MPPLNTSTLSSAGTHGDAVTTKFESFKDGLVSSWCFHHVIVLDECTYGDFELFTNREGVPQFVYLQGVVS